MLGKMMIGSYFFIVSINSFFGGNRFKKMDYSQETKGSGSFEKKGAVDKETRGANGSDIEQDVQLEKYPGHYFSLQARWMVQPMSQQYLSETVPGRFLSSQAKHLLGSTVKQHSENETPSSESLIDQEERQQYKVGEDSISDLNTRGTDNGSHDADGNVDPEEYETSNSNQEASLDEMAQEQLNLGKELLNRRVQVAEEQIAQKKRKPSVHQIQEQRKRIQLLEAKMKKE
jgi:hypothetical protein